MAETITFRQNTAALASSHNPVLARGEPGFEYDTGKMKIGDGVTDWNTLPYVVAATVVNTNVSNTFTERQIFNKVAYSPEVALTDAATIAWDMDVAVNARVTITANRTLGNPTHMVAGGQYQIRVSQDGTGGWTLSYGSAYKWPSGIAPVLNPGANAVALITIYSDGTNAYCQIAQAFA